MELKSETESLVLSDEQTTNGVTPVKNNTEQDFSEDALIEQQEKAHTEINGLHNLLTNQANLTSFPIINMDMYYKDVEKKDDFTVNTYSVYQNLTKPIGPAGSEQPTVPDANPLGRLLIHHLSQTPHLTKTDALILLLAAGVAVGAVMLYPRPAKEYAGDDLTRTIFFLASVIAANLSVSYYTGIEVFQSFKKALPDAVQRTLDPHYNRNRARNVIKTVTVGGLSALAATPYALAADEESIEVRVIIGVSNTIMNYYSLNNLMLTHAKWLKNKLSSSIQNRDHQRLLDAYANSVRSIIREIVKSGQIPNKLKLKERNEAYSDKAILQDLADLAQQYQPIANEPMKAYQILLRRIVPGVLGTLLISGLVIYLLKTYESLDDLNQSDKKEAYDISITGAISIPFLYMAVTFGATTMIDVADLIAGKANKPIAMQLYPKTTIAAMIATAGLVSLSFATIARLVMNDRYLHEGGKFHNQETIALIIAAIGAVVFNNYACQKLVFKAIEAWARRFGQKKELANFAIEMESFIQNTKNHTSAEVFATSMKDLSPEQQIALMPMSSVQENVEDMLKNTEGVGSKDNVGLFSVMRLPKNARSFYANFYTRATSTEIDEFERKPLNEQLHTANTKYGTTTFLQEKDPDALVSNRSGCCARLTNFWNKLPSLPRFRLNRRDDLADISSYERINDKEPEDCHSITMK